MAQTLINTEQIENFFEIFYSFFKIYRFMQGGNHGNQYTVANEKLFNLPNSNYPSTQTELAES